MVNLSSLTDYLDRLLSIPDHPDYRTALNGLQVQGGEQVRRVGAAVDTSEAVIRDAADQGVDLLLVHHGLFWDGLRPLTDRRFRKVRGLMEGGMALYSAHLPLDGHPEFGNCILLARALELQVEGRFGTFEGASIGWVGTPAEWDRAALVERCARALGGSVQLLDGGPEQLRRVAVVTGGGGSFIEEAAREGVDTLVTGEGSHHTFVDAHELGVNVIYGGHYRTETFGVKALAEHLAETFELEAVFLDHPSGL
jgi:dinuclear metal center YbgI/SA1388 family protein